MTANSSAFDFRTVLSEGSVVTWLQGTGEPRGLTRRLVAQRAELPPCEIFIGITTSDTLKPELADRFRFRLLNGAGNNRVLTAAGIEVPAREMDGADLVSLVRTPPSAPRTFYWRMGQRAALREGDWKIVRDGGPRQAGPWRLFNLAADVGEANDLAEKDPAHLATLVKRWEEWNSQQQAPRW